MEVWKNIEDYGELYQVSNLGRIKSLKWNTEKILRSSFDTKKYLIIGLSDKLTKKYKVHRLVAVAFIPNPDNKPQINHKNGIKTDNRVENLEWVTAKENMAHACKNKLVNNRGEKNGKCKLNSEQVNEIKYRNLGLSISKISRIYNVSRKTILDIRSNKTWNHI